MNTVILRRRKLGATSCREISNMSKQGIKVVRNDRPVPDNTDLVIRWGTTSNVPTRNVLNTAHAIHAVTDKAGFRMVLDEHDLCPPTTLVMDLLNNPVNLKYPLVIRPANHAQGRNLFVANTYEEAVEIGRRYPRGYASTLINKVAEYRVFVVQGRVACVAQKTPGNPDDVAWNVAQGGRFDNVRWDNWPLKAVRYAIEAFNLSELDFGGVDVMVDDKGEPYVIEINSAPSLTSPYRQSCMSKCFDWIIEHGKERIPLVEKKGGYLKFIHPAVCERAELVRE